MKLLNSKNLKLRNETFDWTRKVSKFVVSRELLRLKKNMWGILVQQEKLKNHMKLTDIVPKTEGDYHVNK